MCTVKKSRELVNANIYVSINFKHERKKWNSISTVKYCTYPACCNGNLSMDVIVVLSGLTFMGKQNPKEMLYRAKTLYIRRNIRSSKHLYLVWQRYTYNFLRKVLRGSCFQSKLRPPLPPASHRTTVREFCRSICLLNHF